MRAGTLRHRVLIEKPHGEPDAHGDVKLDWEHFASVRAAIRPASGAERVVREHVEATTTHAITIRYAAGVTSRMRVLFGTRVFEIESVLNMEERSRELTLLCHEVM